MAHDYHEGQPNFSPQQILKDGCKECKHRSENIDLAIGHMDRYTFARAWNRAALWAKVGLHNGSQAEMSVIRAIRAMQVKLQESNMLA